MRLHQGLTAQNRIWAETKERGFKFGIALLKSGVMQTKSIQKQTHNWMKHCFYGGRKNAMKNFRPNTRVTISGALGAWVSLSLVLAFLYRLSGSNILHIGTSDFLTAFPNFKVSRLLGKEQLLYENSLAQAWMGEENWHYGPLHQFITIPLHLFQSIDDATSFLFFFLLLGYVGTTLTFYWITHQRESTFRYSILLSAILIINYPFLAALHQRNLEILELTFIVLAMYVYRKGQFTAAGAFIGIAAGIKFLPGIIIIHFVISKNWRALKGFLWVTIPEILLAQITLGWQNSWVLHLLLVGEKETIPLRQGLNDVLLRFSNENNRTAFTVIYFSLSLIILVATICYLSKYITAEPQGSRQWRIWPLLIAISCLIAPHANSYYFVLLIPLIIQLSSNLTSERFNANHLLFALGLLLLSFPLPFAILWRAMAGHANLHWQNILLSIQSGSPVFLGCLILIYLGLKQFKPSMHVVK